MNHAAWSLASINLVVTLLVFGWVLYIHELRSAMVVKLSLRPHHRHWSSSDDCKFTLVDMVHAAGTVLDKNETVSKCLFVQEHKRFPWKCLFTGEKNTSILSLQNTSNDTHKSVKIFVKQCSKGRKNQSRPSTSDCYVTIQSAVSLNTFTHTESVIAVCQLPLNINATIKKLPSDCSYFILGEDINSTDIVDKPLSGHVFYLKSINNKSENTSKNNLTFIRVCSKQDSCYKTQNLSPSIILLNGSKTMRNARKISCLNFIMEVNSRDKTYSYTLSNSEPGKKQFVNELTRLHIHYTRIFNCPKSLQNVRKMFFEFIEELISKDNLYCSYITSSGDSHKKRRFITDLDTKHRCVNNNTKSIGGARKISYLEFMKLFLSKYNLYSNTTSNIEYHKIQFLNRLSHLRINYTRVRNGSVLEPAIFEKIIIDKNAEVGRQRFKREAEMETDESLSEYFDSILDIFINVAKHNLQGPKKGKVKIPDFAVNFKRNGRRSEGSVKAREGWLLGADSLQRRRSSKILQKGNTFHISTELQFNMLTFGYNHFEANFPFWRPRGRLEGVIPRTKMEIKMDVPLPNGTECNVIIRKVEVTELKNVRVEINGEGFFSNVAPRATSRALENFKSRVTKMVSAQVETAMRKAMTSFPCGLFTSGTLLNFPKNI